MRLIVLALALVTAFIAAPSHDEGCRWSPHEGFEGDCRVMDGDDVRPVEGEARRVKAPVIVDDGAPF